MLACRPSVIGLRVDRHRRRLRVKAECPRSALQEHAGRFHRQRRHGIGTRSRRIERTRLARHAQLPLRLRIVRLKFFVSDRPVGQPRALHRAEHARFVEIARAKAPEVAGEVSVAAADQPPVNERQRLLRLVVRRCSKRLRLRHRVVAVMAPLEGVELVVIKLALREPRTLFQDNDRESGRREFLGDNAAGRA